MGELCSFFWTANLLYECVVCAQYSSTPGSSLACGWLLDVSSCVVRGSLSSELHWLMNLSSSGTSLTVARLLGFRPWEEVNVSPVVFLSWPIAGSEQPYFGMLPPPPPFLRCFSPLCSSLRAALAHSIIFETCLPESVADSIVEGALSNGLFFFLTF